MQYIYFRKKSNNPLIEIVLQKSNCKTYITKKFRSYDLYFLCNATNIILSKTSLSPIIISVNKNLENVFLCDYFLEKNKNNCIWWPQDFIDQKKNFINENINFCVYDYIKME